MDNYFDIPKLDLTRKCQKCGNDKDFEVRYISRDDIILALPYRSAGEFSRGVHDDETCMRGDGRIVKYKYLRRTCTNNEINEEDKYSYAAASFYYDLIMDEDEAPEEDPEEENDEEGEDEGEGGGGIYDRPAYNNGYNYDRDDKHRIHSVMGVTCLKCKHIRIELARDDPGLGISISDDEDLKIELDD